MSIREQVRAMGGPAKLSAKLVLNGKNPSQAAISMWSTRNWVPYRWKPLFEAALVEARQADVPSRDAA